MTDVRERLSLVRDRIEEAARRSGRKPDEITLVAVSKTFPIETIVDAAQAGVTDFGENKAQEFAAKVDALSGPEAIRWHFVGHLQRNKAKLVVGRATLFHGLDSARLARAIEVAAERSGTCMDCLIQINISDEESKFGIMPADLPRLADDLSDVKGLRVRGLMTMASPNPDPNVVRSEFRLMRRLRDSLSSYGLKDARILSMGMSGDFEIAIEEGATHVRIGSAIFGSRCLLNSQ